MIKGKRVGFQILQDGSAKMTVSIPTEYLSEAINMHDLFISADMPEQEINVGEIKKRCMEALDKAMEFILRENPTPVDLTGELLRLEGQNVRNSG